VATKRDRQRQLARQRYERRLDRHAQQARRTRQLWVSSIAAVLLVGVGTGSAALAGAFKSSPPKKPVAAASPTVPASPSASASPAEAAALVNGKCVYTAGGTASRKVSLPPAKPDITAKYTATITTNRGAVVISLLNSKAPCTVNSFVSLADQKFFNNTPCPRLVTTGIYVLQCGDPTGTGSGGPGYTFNDENLTGATYPTGTVAMANAGAGTNGSQFFLVFKNTPLPPSYTPFGTITSGLSVLQTVAAAGDDNSNPAGGGKPKDSVQIESVTISKT
jgi:peptidyl-prolyl cis-trans isomerase B (cyclophilin B)